MYKIVGHSSEKISESYDSINDLHDQTDRSNDSKICSEFGSGELVDLQSLRSRIRNPEYVCSSCGRSASEKSSLCWPEAL
jgi:hypothetical protein